MQRPLPRERLRAFTLHCCLLSPSHLSSSLHVTSLQRQSFDTTQGKKHEDAGAVKIKSARGARQFMNRRVRLAAAAWLAG